MMPGILSDGEYSLFFFDGQFSHAIVKRPAAGDFRVQEQFGGRETAWDASDAAGKLHIMELELIEPSLFLHFAEDKGAAFGKAVAGAAMVHGHG